MKKFKVGIAGYGIVGQRRRSYIESHPCFQLVAICDRVFDSLQSPSDGIIYYSKHEHLLREDLDVLFVALSNDVAASVTYAGLEAGLHVFCEKPPGRSLSEIAKVFELHKSLPNQKLMYGFNHRHHDSVIDALNIIKSGYLGSVINIKGVYGKSKLITFNQSDWRTQRAISGGGVLLDQGIHMLDLMRLFVGDFESIHSHISNSHWGYDVEDNAYALMCTSTGVTALFNSSATQWRHRFYLDINLTLGSIVLSGFLTGSKSYGAETLTTSKVDHLVDAGEPREQITKYNQDHSWKREIDHFAHCISTGDDVMFGTPYDAFMTMRLVYQIYYADPKWRARFDIDCPTSFDYLRN